MAQPGTTALVGAPCASSDTPSTPVVSNVAEPMRVTPRNWPFSRIAWAASSGVSKCEASPQYSAGCALRICRPLPTMASMQARLSQCISRSGQRWRTMVRISKRGLAACALNGTLDIGLSR